MVYKKLISYLLIAVLLLQVVSVGGIASADPFTPLDQLNQIRSSDKDIEVAIPEVQGMLESGSLIDMTDISTTYNLLNDEQKKELTRGIILLLPREVDYESQSQVEYVFALLYNLLKMPKVMNSNNAEYLLDEVYGLYSQAGGFLPYDEAQPMVEASVVYNMLSGVDKPMYMNIAMFGASINRSQDSVPYGSQLNFMKTLIDEYRPINTPNNVSDMDEALNSMMKHNRMTRMMSTMDSSIVPFPVQMEKMEAIEENDQKREELAQWMIDHKPQNGYETVSEVQKEFDAFFEPNSSALLEQFNDIKEKKDQDPITDFIPEVIELLSNKNFIATPDFESLSEEEQSEIAKYMLEESSPPASSRYKSKEQVQYVVQLALQAMELPHKIGGTDSREILDAFFNKQAERIQQQFNDIEADDEYYELIHYYLDSSEVERRMAAFRYERKLTKKLDISEILNYTQSALDETPFINKVETSEEMLKKLINMLEIQGDIERYNSDEDVEIPLGTFPLDVSKLDNLTSEEQKQLADHMLTERPLGGYASFEAIQTAFNKFFPDDNEDPLTVLNTAKSNSNIEAMRMAMEDPDLGITLPNGYGALSLQVRDFIAGFLIDYVNKDYKNKEQVQYMIELGVLAQSVWEQRELSVLRNKLDLLAQQLVNGPNHFNDQQTYVLRSLGQQHLERSKVDKGVLAYNYLHLVAFERLEGVSKGDIVDPDIVLNLLSMPIDSFEQATSIPRMDQWLDVAMKNQIKGEAFFSKYKFNLRGALDLSKRAELSPEGQKELAEWVLNEQDSYEDVGNLQYVFNRFFTAPDVKGNDINNTLMGLDSTMEISFDNKLHWIDVAFIQKMDLSGNKTVWVRYKAISDELPGRAVKFVFTQNGDSSTDNGNTPTPNPGGSTGGGSSTTTPVTSTPAPTTKQEQIVVDVNGTNGINLTKTPITRTTETNGTIKDLVKMTEAIAKESVEKAKQLNMNTARIVIPDTKDAVSETRIEVPKAAVKELNEGSLKLEISTENVVISVPTSSIAGFDQDLYFRVVPLKKESERKEVEERAKKEQLIQQVAPNTNVRVLARPVEIDTNMQSREVTLTLPLRDSLPTDPAARQQALDNLAIYIEHSDGTKELIQGKLVQLANNSEGIEFTVTKFSTFTLVVVDGLKASQSTHQPYIQGFGTDFRPDAFVTRAQMAAMLARNLPTEPAAGSTNGVSYKDVSATHWATSEIQKAQSAGIMNGMSNTQFAPEGSITRAQMATIAYRWMQQQANSTTVNGTVVSFTDVSAALWAADAIAYVQSAGLMVGYNDGTFKPDSKLTRAEAVKVLNVLFNRTPLTGAVTPTFSDVPATHWAYADIEAAAQK
ncbi:MULTISPECIES: S-layer homology domain-containing protein [unclassified Paenibacillus]|uniref:S-layer homology domain-containing protein n=1 Tax=unclassified Paenibacillus TaxID=185978 RepID=UPI00122E55F1|nr:MULTISPECIES: S-layer homology domain-containing protein [unclassified Paenibacillus]QZN76962.1 S-layer homology domain-containing protein [Paenibacillus sp. DR312]